MLLCFGQVAVYAQFREPAENRATKQDGGSGTQPRVPFPHSKPSPPGRNQSTRGSGTQPRVPLPRSKPSVLPPGRDHSTRQGQVSPRSFDHGEVTKIESCLQRRFSNRRIRLVLPPNSTFAGVYIGQTFVGELFIDDEHSGRSYKVRLLGEPVAESFDCHSGH